MSHAEIITLRHDEIEDCPPMIKHVRQKSSVYGEFTLWPETRRALQWRGATQTHKNDLVMITSKGRPYNRQRISNAWANLRLRIERQEDMMLDWWLPFKHLRKTAAQLVRNESDGEIAGVFLSHGRPVASDELADVYSNRPFGRVTEALEKVHHCLKPVFKTASNAFDATMCD